MSRCRNACRTHNPMHDRPIRVADKNLHGDVPLSNRQGINRQAVGEEFKKEQQRRVEEIAARVRTDMEFLKANEIKPFGDGSAQDFDQLKQEAKNGL